MLKFIKPDYKVNEYVDSNFYGKAQNILLLLFFFRNFAIFDSEITPSRQKMKLFLCFMLDFS